MVISLRQPTRAHLPDIRAELKDDSACLPAIRRLQGSKDPMIAKHASIALETVLWEP